MTHLKINQLELPWGIFSPDTVHAMFTLLLLLMPNTEVLCLSGDFLKGGETTRQPNWT